MLKNMAVSFLILMGPTHGISVAHGNTVGAGLLAKVSKEVNICVGRVLHKAGVDAFNHKTSLYNYRNKNLQRATDVVQLPVV